MISTFPKMIKTYCHYKGRLNTFPFKKDKTLMSLRNQHPLITKKMFIILKTTHKQLLIIYKRYSYLASHERKRDILIYAAPLLPCPGILPHKIMLFICTKFCAAVFHVSLRITQNMEGSNLFLGPPDSVRHHLRLRGERGRSQR